MYCGIVKYEEWVFWLITSRWIDDNKIKLAELSSASRFSRYFEQVEESLLQLLACACG
jgi:hypothetical protein